MQQADGQTPSLLGLTEPHDTGIQLSRTVSPSVRPVDRLQGKSSEIKANQLQALR